MGGGRERGVVRNDRTNIQDIWRQNRSPQGADVAGDWERGAIVKGEGQSAEVPGGGTKRNRADNAGWEVLGVTTSPAPQESPAQKKTKPAEELGNTKKSYLNAVVQENDEVETMLSENEAVQELQRLRTENKELKEIMILDKQERLRAEQKLTEHLNRMEVLPKLGFIQKTKRPDGWRFIDLFQRFNLCSKYYQKEHNRNYMRTTADALSSFNDGDKVTPCVCERLGPCPFSHQSEERFIELRLNGKMQSWKSKPCDNYKDGGCCFPDELCYYWHWDADIKKDVKLRCFGQVHKSKNCAKGVLVEHCQEIVKSSNELKQENERLYEEGVDMVEAREKRLGKEEGRQPYDKLSNRSFKYFEAVKKLVKAGRLTMTEDLEFDATEMIEAAEKQEYIKGKAVKGVGHSWRTLSAYIPPISITGDSYTAAKKTRHSEELKEIRLERRRRSPRDHASRDYRGKCGGAASEPEAEGPSN
eukprot:SAG11_NODE_228_length_11986_cov_128.901153_14_plen_473_part_00